LKFFQKPENYGTTQYFSLKKKIQVLLSYEFSEELYPNFLVKLVMTTPSPGNYYGETSEGLKIFIIPEAYGGIYTSVATRQCIFVSRDASRVVVFSLLRNQRLVTSTWFEKMFIHQQALVVQ
jgi:hypothetical protein